MEIPEHSSCEVNKPYALRIAEGIRGFLVKHFFRKSEKITGVRRAGLLCNYYEKEN
jgi:hypothetical protein